MTSSKTKAETFVEQLEIERSGFDDDAHPLPRYQYDAFCLCRDLLLESDVSQAQRSRQHRISRQRVRNLLIDVYRDLGAEVFLLCTLAASITKLATITHKDLFPKLRTWWKAAACPHGLTEIASELHDAHLSDALVQMRKRKRATDDTGLKILQF